MPLGYPCAGTPLLAWLSGKRTDYSDFFENFFGVSSSMMQLGERQETLRGCPGRRQKKVFGKIAVRPVRFPGEPCPAMISDERHAVRCRAGREAWPWAQEETIGGDQAGQSLCPWGSPDRRPWEPSASGCTCCALPPPAPSAGTTP